MKTQPTVPRRNGVAERANRTLVEMALTMFACAGLDESFWAEAIKTASYLRNRAETTTLPGLTPLTPLTSVSLVPKPLC